MVKISSDIVWMVTKKNSAFKVQRPGAKSRKEAHSSARQNLTGLWNASAQTNRVGLQATKGISKSKKGSKTILDLHFITDKHEKKGGKVAKNQWDAAKCGMAVQHLTNGANKAAKTIGGIRFANDKLKTVLKRRLFKLHKAAARSAQLKK